MCKGGPGFHILLEQLGYWCFLPVTCVLVAHRFQVLCYQVPVVLFDFGLDTVGGLPYTVLATNTSTDVLPGSYMAGSPAITINPLPTQYPLTIAGTASASYCLGTTGLDIQLGNSKAEDQLPVVFRCSTRRHCDSGFTTGHAVDFGILRQIQDPLLL